MAFVIKYRGLYREALHIYHAEGSLSILTFFFRFLTWIIVVYYFQVHFAVKHSNECKLYRCTACPSSSAVFRSELDFSLHVRSAHAPLPLLTGATSKTPTQQPYRCLFCRLSFATELEMQFHLAAHSKQFHCPLCQEAFHVEFLLDKHMQTHHSSQVIQFIDLF